MCSATPFSVPYLIELESAEIAESASRARKAVVPVGGFLGADELDALGRDYHPLGIAVAHGNAIERELLLPDSGAAVRRIAHVKQCE